METKMKLKFAAIAAICFLNSCSNSNWDDKFSYSLIPVQSDEKWGYIDKDGKYLINPQFKKAYLFTDGIALVESQDGKMGYIGEDGKYLINPTYRYASNFSEGLAFVTPENSFPTCIDKSGEIKFVLKEAELVSSFKEELAYVKIKDKYGFVVKNGKIVINPQFDAISNFSEGLAAFGNKKEKDSNELSWGYIDKNGKIVINAQFKEARDFKEGKAIVKNDDKKYGFIDKKGLYCINPQFDDAIDFSESHAGIKQGDTWGYINEEGKIVINPQFDDAGSFKSGLAPVRSGKDQWGYIDIEGKYIINPQFKSAAQFYGDFAPVLSGDKIGLIDKQGKFIVNPQFTNIFTEYFGWSNFLYGNTDFDYVKSDYYDITKFTSVFLSDCKDGIFNGLSNAVTLIEIIDLPENKGNLKEDGSYTAVNYTEKEITEDIKLDKVIYGFQDKIYALVPQYYYGYSVGTSKQLNEGTKLSSIEYHFSMNSYKNAEGKGKTIADGIKSELIKIYKGSEKPTKQLSENDKKSLNSLNEELDKALADLNSTIDTQTEEMEILNVYSSEIEFKISSNTNMVIVRVYFTN